MVEVSLHYLFIFADARASPHYSALECDNKAKQINTMEIRWITNCGLKQ